MKRRKQNRAAPDQAAAEAPAKPYGYVLILRALAGAAIQTGSPAALRVLCVLAEYVDQNGVCRVGQETLAARLFVTRQAINRLLRILIDEGFIEASAPKTGVTLRYKIVTEGLADERVEGDAPARRRARKKKAERAAKGLCSFSERLGYMTYIHATLTLHKSEEDARRIMVAFEASQGVRYERVDPAGGRGEIFYRKVQHPDVAGSPPEGVQHPDVSGVQHPDVAGGATPGGFTGCNIQMLHEETSLETSPREFRERGEGGPALAEGSGPAALSRGDYVFHPKFGRGRVARAEGSKLYVDFDKVSGQRLIVDSFVTVVAEQPNGAGHGA